MTEQQIFQTDLKIVPAVEADCERAFAIKQAAFASYVDAIWGWDETAQRKFHQDEFVSATTRFVLLRGTSIGWWAFREQDGYLLISALYILPQFQRRGVGTWCLSQILSETDQGKREVRLGVLENNRGARRFYEKFGFQVVRRNRPFLQLRRTATTRV
jgi:ribosomal protein S18 acetylase RimI-like enzyme